ncbi:MAG: ADP-forming succinate--CoA ligase subunit beta [Deltaproteobacteria bacterium]|nr:ADP-forming succinate--CoA ligase subunit beta [Deltaproteobacteria bacterium]
MKLHEYQAKGLLKSFGVPVPDGRMAESAEAAAAAAAALGGDTFVVKAQVHAGGRGKAGGVKVVSGIEGVREAAAAIIGMRLVSRQTGPAGKVVSKVLVEKGVAIAREMYLGMLVDRDRGRVVVIASAEGGVEIEEVAARSPEKILKVHVDPAVGLMPYQCRILGYGLDLPQDASGRFAKVVACCARALVEKDLSLVELNPLVLTAEGDIAALDAKLNADDNALFRQKDVAALRDLSEEDWREVEAGRHGLSYIGLEGSIGCLVNGAGLAMATMDIIKHCGEEPANFLDVGGGATVAAVTAGFKIILADPKVRAVLVNIFGGIMKCDIIAESVVAAAREVGVKVPLVVRLQGTNADLGRGVLEKSGLAIIPAVTMDEAARKVVEAVGN